MNSPPTAIWPLPATNTTLTAAIWPLPTTDTTLTAADFDLDGTRSADLLLGLGVGAYSQIVRMRSA